MTIGEFKAWFEGYCETGDMIEEICEGRIQEQLDKVVEFAAPAPFWYVNTPITPNPPPVPWISSPTITWKGNTQGLNGSEWQMWDLNDGREA
jgi:hypothetical protein